MFVLLLALACEDEVARKVLEGGGGGESEDEEAATLEDEALLRAAIAGEADAAETLQAIAWSEGLPVETAGGTYLFACLCGDGDWMLAGDHTGWDGETMTRSGDLWWIESAVASPDGSLYKFTDGSDWVSDPLARRYGFDDYGEFSLVRATDAHLERWPAIGGGGLAERDLAVWVPDDGEFTHALYAHDGQNLFDPDAMWGGWRLQDSVPDGMLVVGIANTYDRIDEYTHTTDRIDGSTMGGRADDYATLVDDVVRPAMEARYGSPEVVGLLGSSLGGLVSFYVAHARDGRYDFAASLSGTMGWGSIGTTNATIVELYEAAGHRDTALYLDSGGGGSTCADSDGDGIDDDDPGASDNYCENLQLRDVLEDAGYEYELDLWHWHEAGAEHDEAAWADRVWRPLEAFAGLE